MASPGLCGMETYLLFIFSCAIICVLPTSSSFLHTVKSSSSDVFEISATDKKVDESILSGSGRAKRSTTGTSQFKYLEAFYELNDNNTQALISWAGQYSDAIVVLTKPSGTNGHSNLYVSLNYGLNYTKKNLCTVRNNTQVCATLIDKIYHSPISWASNRYVFTDKTHNLVITTGDLRTFTVSYVPFKADKIVMCTHANPALVAALETSTYTKSLYISSNFGRSWTHKYSRVKKFFWGHRSWDFNVRNYLHPAFYVEAHKGYASLTKVMRFNSSSDSQGDLVEDGTIDFGMKDDYKFVVKRENYYDTSKTARKNLLVAYKKGPFRPVDIPTLNHLPQLDYYVAEASENQVFLIITHGLLYSNLYISDENGTRYSLSLTRVVYYNPDGPHSVSWLNHFEKEIVADITKVDGLNGIYFASDFVQNVTNASQLISGVRTRVSYDKGGEWTIATAPYRNSTGHFQHCYRTYHCSLHFAQDLFSNPPVHYSPILSSENAIGLLTATGVYGAAYNLSIGPQLFFSNDAGRTWKDVVNGSYHYAYGDHGGVIVAVLKNAPTAEYMYSVNEGSTWVTETFADSKLMVYGLLTEPGSRTLVFTLWGAFTNRAHNWVVTQLNFTDVFGGARCSPGDYKAWSPSTPYGRHCLLGTSISYQRRAPHSLCYNSEHFIRRISSTICDCDRGDYECDDGYMEDNSFSRTPRCIKMNGTASPSVPHPCRLGHTYERTKGYRRVSTDQCTGGVSHIYEPYILPCPQRDETEFIVYAATSEIHQFDLDSSVDRRIRVPYLSGGVQAVEWDKRTDTLYFADNTAHIIRAYSLNTSIPRNIVYLGSNQRVTSLSLDWYSNNIYWVDQRAPQIEVVSTDGRWRQVLFNRTSSGGVLRRPEVLELVPSHGIMFWVEASTIRPAVVRANMDGTNITTIVSRTRSVGGTRLLRFPRCITSDPDQDFIYVGDSSANHIFQCSFSGTQCRIVVKGSQAVHYPHGLGLFENELYWTDGYTNCLHSAIISSTSVVAHSLVHNCSSHSVYAVKVIDVKRQHVPKTTPCLANSAGQRGDCRHLCLLSSNSSRTCLCPDDFITEVSTGKCMCQGAQQFDADGNCVESANCTSTEFECASTHSCIDQTWLCDRHSDCPDHSDEKSCPFEHCDQNQFRCPNSGHCIPHSWLCDFDNDCHSEQPTDELNCNYPSCSATQFQCANQRCIRDAYECDGDNDCGDRSDERNCNNTSNTTTISPTCPSGSFRCFSGSLCVGNATCDGTWDCPDGSDEANCPTVNCTSYYQRRCANRQQCVSRYAWCNGYTDCSDGSDERTCSSTTIPPTTPTPAVVPCPSWGFQCNNGMCIPLRMECDGSHDCGLGDWSDEDHCSTTRRPYPTTPFIRIRPTPSTDSCLDMGMFPCYSSGGNCIPMRYRCDGFPNCANHEDENPRVCQSTVAPVRCDTGLECLDLHGQTRCLSTNEVCNKVRDCLHNEDETGCHIPPRPSTCTSSQFQCAEGSECIAIWKQCDYHGDCEQGSDESNCTSHNGTVSVNVGLSSSANTSLSISTILSPAVSGTYTVINYRLSSASDHWKLKYGGTFNNRALHEHSVSAGSSIVNIAKIDHLLPGSRYDVRVLVQKRGEYNLHSSLDQWSTLSGAPENVTNLVVIYNYVDQRVMVTFDLPLLSKRLSRTTYELIVNGSSRVVDPSQCIGVHCSAEFYFWGRHEKAEILVVVKACVQRGTLCSITQKNVLLTMSKLQLSDPHVSGNTMLLTWGQVAQAKYYTIRYSEDGCDITRRTSATTYTIDNLIPKQQYGVEVSAFSENGHPVCQPDTKSTTIGGTPPPIISDTKYNEDTATITWNTVDKPSQNVGPYEIIYSHDYSEVSGCATGGAQTVNTTNAYYAFPPSTLAACEAIYYRIRSAAPNKGHFTTIGKSFLTKTDPNAPPKDLHVEDSSDCPKSPLWYKVCKRVEWTRACEHDGSAQFSVAVDNSRPKLVIGEAKLNFVATLGKEYKLTVIDKNNTASTTIYYTADPIVAVVKVSCSLIPDGPMGTYVEWSLTEDFQRIFKPETMSFIVRQDGRQVILTKQRYGLSLDVDYGNDLSVQLVTNSAANATLEAHAPEGTCFRHAQVMPHTSDDSSSSNKSLTVGLPIAAGCIVVILAGILTVWCIKHKRLQRSFMNFAHSRYDTRTGTTTFTTDDDEDSPMIQGFSDDEPLVVA